MANRAYVWFLKEGEWPDYATGEFFDPDRAAAAGSNCLPLFWLAGFSTTDVDAIVSGPQMIMFTPVNSALAPADRRLVAIVARAPGLAAAADHWMSLLCENEGGRIAIELTEYAELSGATEMRQELKEVIRAFDAATDARLHAFLEAQDTDAGALLRAVDPPPADTLSLLLGHSWVGRVPWEP